MRLTCPNCGARYEVDASMIPPEGRDVQCSNCATTWFQPGNRAARVDTVSAEPEGAMPADDHVAAGMDEDASAAQARRELDPALRDILREEREREEALRQSSRAQPDPVETQEEMALDEGPATPAPDGGVESEPVQREDDDDLAAALDEIEQDQVESADLSEIRRARREMLPDIEEINSTLRAASDRAASESGASDIHTVDVAPRRRRGFRLGFALMLFLTAGLVASYTYAPVLAARVPAAAPALQRYVDGANVMRLKLDALAQVAATQLGRFTGGQDAALVNSDAEIRADETGSAPENGAAESGGADNAGAAGPAATGGADQ